MKRRTLLPRLAVLTVVGLLSFCAHAAPAAKPTAASALDAANISILWSAPFVLLLGSIALMPFVAKHWWEKHYPKVSVGLALLVACYYLFGRKAPLPWLSEMKEYVSFMVLLSSLFVVSGGISIRVNRKATPLANATLLLIGAVVANLFGTTGAAMLLIRPYLRMNRGHVKPYHVVFFIFVVANVGGSLTPIGDPPLFLGYLKGVPFWWGAEHMLGLWAMTVVLLLAVFLVVDTLDHKRGERERDDDAGPQVHILGIHNFVFIGVIVWAVFRPGLFDAGAEILDHGNGLPSLFNLIFSREILMLAAGVASRRVTGKTIYTTNDFSFGPIREVAILFVGIFSTMVPALHWLEHNADKMTIETPGQFYFASGMLSSVLDNAPTYVTFLKARLGRTNAADVEEVRRVLEYKKRDRLMALKPEEFTSDANRDAAEAMVRYHEADIRRGNVTQEEIGVAFLIGSPSQMAFILAISAGSVFWGACTYIGNGPNFMVKSIAEAAGVKTPGFLEYIYKYTLPILIPIYVVVWIVMFMGK